MIGDAFITAQALNVTLAGRVVLSDISLVAFIRTSGGVGRAERGRQDHAAARSGGSGAFAMARSM